MAIQKSITLDNGATASYHNIPGIRWEKREYMEYTPATYELQDDTDAAPDELGNYPQKRVELTPATETPRADKIATITVRSFLDKTLRDTKNKPITEPKNYELVSDDSISIEQAYDYLKTLPEFSGAVNA